MIKTQNGQERVIAFVLRFGVIFSAAIIAAGLILSFIKQDQVQGFNAGAIEALLSGQLQPQLSAPSSVAAFSQGLSKFDPAAVTALGLIFLILLPVARVALTVVTFAAEKDYAYLAITAFVLAVLLSGLFFGRVL